jgi:hypothetical protein
MPRRCLWPILSALHKKDIPILFLWCKANWQTKLVFNFCQKIYLSLPLFSFSRQKWFTRRLLGLVPTRGTTPSHTMSRRCGETRTTYGEQICKCNVFAEKCTKIHRRNLPNTVSIYRKNLSLIWSVFCKRDKAYNWMIARD